MTNDTKKWITPLKGEQLLQAKIEQVVVANIRKKMVKQDLTGLLALLARLTLSPVLKRKHKVLLRYLSSYQVQNTRKLQKREQAMLDAFIKTLTINDLPLRLLDLIR